MVSISKPPHFISFHFISFYFYMKILKIIFSIFFLILYSIAFSQIEILKLSQYQVLHFIQESKITKRTLYIGLFASRAINDSVYVDNKFVVKSKGKIHPIYGKSSAYIFLTLDSNYNASKVHQIYGIRDVNGSRLLLASDSCIYFSILAYDSVYINEELIFMALIEAILSSLNITLKEIHFL